MAVAVVRLADHDPVGDAVAEALAARIHAGDATPAAGADDTDAVALLGPLDPAAVGPAPPAGVERIERVAADLAARGGGRLVVVVSGDHRAGRGSADAAGVSAGLVGAARTTAAAVAGAGIAVNVVTCGRTTAASPPDPGAARSLLRRPVTPDEVAATVLFLLSPAAGFCVGSVWPVDGGASVGFG